MADSILTSIKKILGITEADTSFDTDIVIHVNTVFTTLHQLGIGPVSGFAIEDASAIWADFIGADILLNSVKTYVYLRVRMLFDPPTTSYLMAAMKEQILEFEVRLQIYQDNINNSEATA